MSFITCFLKALHCKMKEKLPCVVAPFTVFSLEKSSEQAMRCKGSSDLCCSTVSIACEQAVQQPE